MRASSKQSKDPGHRNRTISSTHHPSSPSLYNHIAKPRAAAIIPPAGTTNPKSAAALLVDAGPAVPVAVAMVLPAPPVAAGAVVAVVTTIIVAVDPKPATAVDPEVPEPPSAVGKLPAQSRDMALKKVAGRAVSGQKDTQQLEREKAC